MNNRTRFFRIFIILILFGVLNLVAILTNPTFQSMRVVHIIRLIATGMCFGAALVALAIYLRSNRTN